MRPDSVNAASLPSTILSAVARSQRDSRKRGAGENECRKLPNWHTQNLIAAAHGRTEMASYMRYPNFYSPPAVAKRFDLSWRAVLGALPKPKTVIAPTGIKLKRHRRSDGRPSMSAAIAYRVQR
ncbi:MAG: hypothetical protein QOF09_5011 [Alphaproteobacteria bacterium]|nr:hypothetical protein [Alphaproteobacteria bacterium]